ncbi:MAG: serine/threonine-protein kinase [bacterium]
MSVDLKPGDRFLDRFRVEYLAAEGGMASIYAARDELTSHTVALKVLYPYYSDNAIIRARFIEEGRIQQLLRHPNIIRVFQIQDVPFLAILMEFVEGPTLDDFLASNGPLTTSQVIDVIIPCMSAVGFAHSQGVIHRDLKPSNILLPDGDIQRPKVLDFGVAKIKGGRHDLTATGTTVGTLHYMSPEQIVGSKSIDGRADIYSIGVMMYKLVTGEVPFNAPTEFALMMAQVEAPPLPPSRLRPEVNPGLERIILKAMEKKPQDRFQTIRDFTQALLDLRIESQTATVGDTLSGKISSELLSFAINADEIAVDRSEDMFSSKTDRIEATALPMDLATMEIEATLKIQRPPEATAELSNSAIVRISNAEIDQIESEQETTAIPSLKNQGEDVTKLTPPSEVKRLIESSQSNPIQAKDDSQAVLRTLPTPKRVTHGPASTEHTRPSKPSALVKQSGLQALAPRTQPVEPEDFETVSIARPIRESDLEEASDALRRGVLVADPHIDSRDLTAPKMSRESLKQYLPTPNQATPSFPAPVELKSSQASPLVIDVPKNSGPKMILGKDYADTSERTRQTPPSPLEQSMINDSMRQSQHQQQLMSGFQAPPGSLDDGRITSVWNATSAQPFLRMKCRT